MKALGILAAVLLILFLAGQLRLGVRAEYSAQGLNAWARLGMIQFPVFPPKQKDKPAAAKKPKKKRNRSRKCRKPPTRPIPVTAPALPQLRTEQRTASPTMPPTALPLPMIMPELEQLSMTESAALPTMPPTEA